MQELAPSDDTIAMGSIAEREQILATLDELHRWSLKVIAKNDATLDEIRSLSRDVTAVRLLLEELARVDTGSAGGDRSAEAVRDMRERYYELEGRVKELRNERERFDAGRRR